MKIDPMSKVSVFSDSLNVEKAIEIKKACEKRIKPAFGIGTHFTNDFDDALNIVVKMNSLNGNKVAKLSDDIGKASGDPDAIKVAKYTFLGEKL
jgi:nicotinate phosphoribosyltransferase